MFRLLQNTDRRVSPRRPLLVPQRAGVLIGEAAAPPAGHLVRPREPSGSTCGLISPPTWESAHRLNERGKKKTVCRCQPGPAPPDLHDGSRFWDRDSAPTRCAACSCWPEAGGTDVPPESCTSDVLRPSLFRLPLLLSSSFLLPKPFSFFLYFFLAFFSLSLSILLPLCFLYALSSKKVDPSYGDRSWTLSPT